MPVDENFGGVPPWKPSAGNLTNEQIARLRDTRAGGSARASLEDRYNTQRAADADRSVFQAFADQGIAYQPDNPPPGGAY